MTDTTPEAVATGAPARRVGLVRGILAVSLVANVALGAFLIAGDDEAEDDAAVGSSTTTTTQPTTTTTTTTTTLPPVDDAEAGPVRVLVVGDSVASQMGWALHGWAEANPGRIVVFNEAHLGCGVVRYGMKQVDGEQGPVGDVCSNWNVPVALHLAAETETVSWPSAIELFQPDVVLSMVSSWDITDRIVPGVVDDWTSVGDPAYDAYVLSEYTEATAVLASSSAEVFWLTSPMLNRESLPEDHAARVAGINSFVSAAIESVAADDPDAVISQIDYPGWLGEPGGPRDAELRDDGVHLSDAALEVVAEWLLEEMGLIEAIER